MRSRTESVISRICGSNRIMEGALPGFHAGQLCFSPRGFYHRLRMLSSHISKAALLAAALAGAIAAAGEPAPGPEGTEPARSKESGRPARRDSLRSFPLEITPALRLSIDRGFDYLKRNQMTSGSFAGSEGFTVAVNALVGLAFLAGGYTDKEGPYTETVRLCTRCLLSY